MPRDGSNIYHKPAGTDGIPNTTVPSAPYNAYTADVEQDLNLPRPIVAGGTGATSADVALLNLSAEKAKQVVTNWDSMIWLAGSFYAATSATGAAPVAGHAFAGIAYYANTSDFVTEAIDLTDAAHIKYIRVMSAGVWGAWAGVNTSLYVLKAGDTITGLLTINNDLTLADPTPTINLNKAAGGNAAGLVARTGANIRWLELLGDTTAESGSNLGSDFVLQAYTDAGAPVTPPALTVKRSLNRLLLAGDPAAALDAATKQYVDAALASALAADAAAMKTAGNQTVTGGFNFTANNLGNIASSFTPNPLLGNYQYGTNHVAATWNAPASDCAIDILVTNDATAGTITFTGYTVGAVTGDTLTTTNTQKFIVSIRRINAVSTYMIKALQ